MGIRLTACVVALAMSCPAAGADWVVDATAGLVAYENVGKSRNTTNYRGATALEFDVVAQTQPAWQTPGVVSFDVWAGFDRLDTLTGLNQFRAGVGASYTDRIGLGPSAPWWSVSARLGRHEFDDRNRDSTRWELGVGIGRAFGADVDAALRVLYTRRDGAARVFDTATTRATAASSRSTARSASASTRVRSWRATSARRGGSRTRSSARRRSSRRGSRR